MSSDNLQGVNAQRPNYIANAAELAALATPESLWIKTFDLERAKGFLALAIYTLYRSLASYTLATVVSEDRILAALASISPLLPLL
jgi:hypothetical protein